MIKIFVLPTRKEKINVESTSRTKQQCGNPSLQIIPSLPHTCFFCLPAPGSMTHMILDFFKINCN